MGARIDPEERTVGSALAMALLWLCVAVGLTGWAVQRSAQVGRLAAPPRYDDINYFNAALRWLHRWSELGPVDALLTFLQDPPRAAFPELLAAGSFAIGGVDLAIPYLASFFIPWVALLWASRFASRAMTIERLLIGLYVCTIPLLTVGVTQFRPDPFWGIVLGGAMGLLLTEQMVGASTRHLIALHRELVGALRTLPPTPAPRRLWVTAPAPITADGLQWMIDREGLAIQAVHDNREGDLPALMRKFADIDLVFAQEEGGIYLSRFAHHRMAAARMQGEILRALRSPGTLTVVVQGVA